MHGTYTHRITCNLYPQQHYCLKRAAADFNSRLAPFVRDAALAYAQKRTLLPRGLTEKLQGIRQEVRRVGTNLNQIAARANTLQRLTHGDLQRAGQLVLQLDRQVDMLRETLESLPYAHQVDGS